MSGCRAGRRHPEPRRGEGSLTQRTLRLGIAGIGNEGVQVARYATEFEGVELTAAADLRSDALAAFGERHAGVRLFESVEAMCAQGDVDAVWIATPSEHHAQHTVTAAQSGKHVILEKPMALSLAESDRIVEAVEKHGVQLLMHSHASDAPVIKIRELVAGGRLGGLVNVTSISYKDWLRSPRLASELDTARGGGVVFRQAPHQIEIVRRIGGGLVRRVLAYTGKWHPHFDTEGNYTALLEFEDGTPAVLVFSGYGYFNIADLTWGIGEGGYKAEPRYGKRAVTTGPVAPAVFYSRSRRGESASAGQGDGERQRFQPLFGLTLVSCERGDIRQSPEGLYVYTDDGCEEAPCPPYEDRATELRELRDAIDEGRAVFPDGRWGRATLEVQLAILESAKTLRHVALSRQVAAPE